MIILVSIILEPSETDRALSLLLFTVHLLNMTDHQSLGLVFPLAEQAPPAVAVPVVAHEFFKIAT